MTASLRPGALVWHPEHGPGRLAKLDEFVPTVGRCDIVHPVSGTPAWSNYKNGWVPVGVDGTVPEGHRLAVISDSMAGLVEEIAYNGSSEHRSEQEDAAWEAAVWMERFVALNPEHGDAQ